MSSESQVSEEFRRQYFVDVGSARVCYRKAGIGPAVVLMHGYPLSGLTWREIVPELSTQFTCYAFDMVGLGDTSSPVAADHSSQGQAKIFQGAIAAIGIESYSLIGNDSGGWIARELALRDTGRVKNLVLTNTEIPGHRPPWVRSYQILARLPGASFLFRMMIAARAWRRSSMGFGGCFDNLELIDGEFAKDFLLPLLLSQDRMRRALRFLINMKFRRIDEFKVLHRRLTMPVTFIWGSRDPTFPEKDAREMAAQFPCLVQFKSIPHAKVFIHEEFPVRLVKPIIQFLTRADF